MTSFAELGLSAPLLSALAATGYTTPTPIQVGAIPPLLAGRDLCGIAQTGTGKTAAFALPLLQRLAAAPRRPASQTCRTLVLSPTRELASQIAASFATYGAELPLTTTVVFGGVPIARQRRQLARGIDILVATPGRLLDLIDTGSLSLGQVEALVLDEADRMLDLGFIHALRRIVGLLPKRRQTLLFSATMPKSISTLADQYLDDPVRVTVAPPATTSARVAQSVAFVPSERKRAALTGFLRDPAFTRVLVFTRTKHGADKVVRNLVADGIDAVAIHGNKSQPQRERALGDFRSGRTSVLVATDIAARGIDVDAVSHVVNFEFPHVAEDYVHRIGRTARAGAGGAALSLCADDERSLLRAVEKLTGDTIRVIAPPPSAGEPPHLGAAEPRHAPAAMAPPRTRPFETGDRRNSGAAQRHPGPGMRQPAVAHAAAARAGAAHRRRAGR